MKDSEKTKDQLIGELTSLRQRISELEALETERRQAEEALEKEKNKIQQYLDIAGVMFLLMNADQKVSLINKKGCEILGYDEKQIIGKNWFDNFIPERIRDKVKEVFRSLMNKEAEPIEYFENPVLTRNGRERIIEWHNSILKDEMGNIIGTISSGNDVTDRKKMETELQKTAKLESLGMLAGGIAHNFNNILTAVTGNIALAKMYAKPGMEVFDIFTEVEKAALRAKNLIQQLLVFSKGGVPIKKVTSIDKLIKDSVGFSLSGSNVRCEFFIPDNLWNVEADEEQISQVINSLVINAHQSMPEGGVIRISFENIIISEVNVFPLKGGKYIKISIKDEGTGIAEENLQKVFDPYFTTKEEGSGLGLAAAYSIVKKHDGHITVESRLGAGTTFFIYIPAYDEEVKTLKDEGKTTFTGEDRGRILVMDDEEIVRTVVGRMLAQCGYEADFAKDGDEAISLYKKAKASGQPFDAVVIDLIIPGGTGGKEAVKRLLEIDPDVRAVVSSGYSNDPVMANFRDYGFKSFLPKPYKIEELCEVLRRVIKAAD